MTHAPDTARFTDAPFADVDSVLAAASGPAALAELAGEDAVVAMFRSQLPARRPRRFLARKAGIAAIGTIGVLSLGGAAAAATGSLPDAAQDTARSALTKVGVDIPAGKATAPGQVKKGTGDTSATGKGQADKTAKPAKPATPVEPAKDSSTAGNGKGETISSIAHDPALSGAEKGAAVSAAASDGKSHAGRTQPAGGPPSSVPAGPPASSPSDTAPGKTTSATAGPRGATAPGSSGSRP